MKFPILPKSLIALTLGACFLAPASSYADRKIKIRRDLDGDGHYNTKTYKIPSRGHYGSGYHHGYGRHHYGSHRPYYSGSYGYRNYGYSRPYYGYGGYGGYGSSFGVSLYSQPSYYYSQPSYYYSQPSYYSERRYVSRSVVPRVSRSYQDSLAVDVQQELKRRGYYRGGIDGNIGPASRSAIRAYQADRGLSVTGRIDRSLLGALGIG